MRAIETNFGLHEPNSVVDTLRLSKVSLTIPTKTKFVQVLKDISISCVPGQVHAIIGESGAGKSMLASVLMGLIPRLCNIVGQCHVAGIDVSNHLDDPTAKIWSRIRGRKVGLIGQSNATFLTPNRTVGVQLAELYGSGSHDNEVEEALESVFLDKSVAYAYPHELSGGMAARVATAFGIERDPELIIADEATVGLDRDVNDAVLTLLKSFATRGKTVLLITHDLSSLLRTNVADVVTVMKQGQIIETGPSEKMLHVPDHPYCRALLAALPENGLRLNEVDCNDCVNSVSVDAC